MARLRNGDIIIKRLKHENIIKYYDSFVDTKNNAFCILMEYCQVILYLKAYIYIYSL